MTQPGESNSLPMDEAMKAGTRFFDAMDHQEVVDSATAAAEAFAKWALELLRHGCQPMDVAGQLGGAGATIALAISSQWAAGNLR